MDIYIVKIQLLRNEQPTLIRHQFYDAYMVNQALSRIRAMGDKLLFFFV